MKLSHAPLQKRIFWDIFSVLHISPNRFLRITFSALLKNQIHFEGSSRDIQWDDTWIWDNSFPGNLDLNKRPSSLVIDTDIIVLNHQGLWLYISAMTYYTGLYISLFVPNLDAQGQRMQATACPLDISVCSLSQNMHRGLLAVLALLSLPPDQSNFYEGLSWIAAILWL